MLIHGLLVERGRPSILHAVLPDRCVFGINGGYSTMPSFVTCELKIDPETGRSPVCQHKYRAIWED